VDLWGLIADLSLVDLGLLQCFLTYYGLFRLKTALNSLEMAFSDLQKYLPGYSNDE
jgi:hypothetical protein